MHFVFMLTWYATINKRRYVQQASHRVQGAFGRGGQGSKQSVIFYAPHVGLGFSGLYKVNVWFGKVQIAPQICFCQIPFD